MMITRFLKHALRARARVQPYRSASLIGTAAVMGGMLAFAGAGGCATAGVYPYNPDRLADDQISQVCQSVVGVEPSEARYFACVGALSDSAKNLGRGRALQQARGDCLSRGYRPGSPDLDVCVVQSSDQARATAPDMAMSHPMEAPGLAKSYAYAPQREVHRREELSCARMGLDPSSGAFASCVAGLDSALFAADNPSQ
jgi:hypothetical protein